MTRVFYELISMLFKDTTGKTQVACRNISGIISICEFYVLHFIRFY